MRTPTPTHLCLYTRAQVRRTDGQRDRRPQGTERNPAGLTTQPLAHLVLILGPRRLFFVLVLIVFKRSRRRQGVRMRLDLQLPWGGVGGQGLSAVLLAEAVPPVVLVKV